MAKIVNNYLNCIEDNREKATGEIRKSNTNAQIDDVKAKVGQTWKEHKFEV